MDDDPSDESKTLTVTMLSVLRPRFAQWLDGEDFALLPAPEVPGRFIVIPKPGGWRERLITGGGREGTGT